MRGYGTMKRALLFATLLSLGACGGHHLAPAAPPGSAATSGDENSPQFQAQLQGIATAYASYGRVDDQMRWAPTLCRMPLPGSARYSEGDPASHGMKLFSVFAAMRDEYIHPTSDAVSVGQVVVKESWKLEAIDPAQELSVTGASASGGALTATQQVDLQRIHSGFYPYATQGGVTYRATDRFGLYMMAKLDPTTADTDQGWLYGTVTMDGTVTAAGRVESCMGCHVASAKHERLFGIDYQGP
jgi:hypothetical protein